VRFLLYKWVIFSENMVRGLDTEEVGFLSMVDDVKAAELRKTRDEEKELLNEVQEAKAKVMLEQQEALLNKGIGAGPSTSTRSKAVAAPKPSKQGQLLAGAIKRKRYCIHFTGFSSIELR
jgi:hypothetical protein